MFIECLEIRWKIAQFCILPLKSFRHIKHSTLCFIAKWNTSNCASYFQFSSFDDNTASHAWYITSRRSRPQLIFVFTFQKKVMVKTPSFTSVTRNSHPPNVYSVPEFSSPLSNACQSSVHQQGKKWFAIQPKRINS